MTTREVFLAFFGPLDIREGVHAKGKILVLHCADVEPIRCHRDFITRSQTYEEHSQCLRVAETHLIENADDNTPDSGPLMARFGYSIV